MCFVGRDLCLHYSDLLDLGSLYDLISGTCFLAEPRSSYKIQFMDFKQSNVRSDYFLLIFCLYSLFFVCVMLNIFRAIPRVGMCPIRLMQSVS